MSSLEVPEWHRLAAGSDGDDDSASAVPTLPLSLPLLARRDLAAPLAWRHGVPVAAGMFIAEARALADLLPAGRPINLCQDRYHFALALSAALLRGQTSLMPPNALPQTLLDLQRDADPGAATAYVLHDAPVTDLGGLPAVRVTRPTVPAPADRVPQIEANLLAVQLLTSGSTGTPQPHAKRWSALAVNIAAEAERLAEHLGLPSLHGVTIVATVPAQHSYGIESTVLLAMLGGAAFDGGRPFFPADVADALARVPEPRALVTTPFHLKTLLSAALPLPRTVLTLSATAPLSPRLAAEAEAALGGVLVEIYGCTEAGQVASRRTTAGDVWTTLGALRLDAVADADGGDARYSVSGGHVPEPTVLADVLALQDPRRFRLLGRANDLIHVGGKRCSLAHLDFQLNRIQGVEDGAFWLPDDDGEDVARTVAFVVAPGLSAADVTHALRRTLEPVFVPRRVLHVVALPRAATGKLTAAALRAFALKTLDAAASESARPWPIAADHPAFDGHFPGRPLLPGVALLSLVMETLSNHPRWAAELGAAPRFEHVKFLAPVAPGAHVTVHLRVQPGGIAFDVRDTLDGGPRTVARGLLAASPPRGPAA